MGSYPCSYATGRRRISGSAVRVATMAIVSSLFGSACADIAVESPAGPESGEPYLSVSGSHVYMSWLEKSEEGGHDLRMATYEEGVWSEGTTIAHSDRFFVNWADFPSITQAGDGSLWTHWLERGSEGGYDYGIRIASSTDGGATWGPAWTPHDDDSPTEHGFLSTVTLPEGLGFTWLDGRKYAPGPDGAEATQEMSLRYRTVALDGTPGPELLVDGRVCDCCQTASAMTDDGPVVVYRNRTEDEIRDIYLARMVDGVWVDGTPVHDDGWNIAGCPVNGPAVVARGTDVAVAWFSAPDDVARVKVAFSQDGGATFAAPVVVDDGNPAGRVDLVLDDDGTVLVSWLERTGGEGAEVRLRRVSPDATPGESVAVSAASSERASGFPRMVPMADGGLLLAWTDVSGDASQVRVALVDAPDDLK